MQLVVSDPKACNNIVIKDPNVFEETRAIVEYVCFSCHDLRHDTLTGIVEICKPSVQRSFPHWVRICASQSGV
jgi:hypothetical protein